MVLNGGCWIAVLCVVCLFAFVVSKMNEARLLVHGCQFLIFVTYNGNIKCAVMFDLYDDLVPHVYRVVPPKGHARV